MASRRDGGVGFLCVLAVCFSVLAVDSVAQQRAIVNPNFVQRFSRAGLPMTDYDASVPNSFCTAPGSCLRYLGDARCLVPSGTPVDTQGCMAGWNTTDPYDSNALNPFVQDGWIRLRPRSESVRISAV
ncbi:MAG TPA: hypothetical protein VEU30_07430 [Thermoanaerobaculia bacterium]|nr:hypothetical protein [Thermoanaerobaculia bacterium]